MNTLCTFMEVLCLAEGMCLFTGKDFLIFMNSTKKEDYNPDRVFQVEKWILLMGAICSLGVGMSRFPDVTENILLVAFGVILTAHMYMLKSKKFRKENK